MGSCSALMTSIFIIITNEKISKLNIRYNILSHCNNVISLFYEKSLKQTIRGRKIDEKEALELKKIKIIILMREKTS